MLEDKDKQKKIRERRLEYIYLFLLMIVFNFITGFFLMKYDFLLTIIHSISVYFLIKVKCLSYDNEELSFKNIFFIKTVNLLNYLLAIILLNIFSKYISFIPIPHFLYLIEILVSSIVVMRLIFVAYIIIDKDLNFIDSIKLSYLLTQKNFIRIFIEIIRFFFGCNYIFITFGTIKKHYNKRGFVKRINILFLWRPFSEEYHLGDSRFYCNYNYYYLLFI